jgi:tetratricopeptide (TPR) repeat protein
VELDDTPFYPQKDHQCGPAALATALGAAGATATPDDLVPLVYLPKRRGSLQVEMLAAPRKYGRLAYPLARNLDAILAELDAGRPVLVLHNYGIPWLPRWHYAVVVGYDTAADSLVLRSGTTRRQVLSARRFMLAWDNGQRWAMVLLRPGELPALPSATAYLEAAAAFEHGASAKDARSAFDAAVQRWPDQPIAWIGRGTAEYRSGSLPDAARDYAAALRIDGTNVGARNNLAMTLLEMGCRDQARTQLDQIRDADVTPSLREAVLDTRARLVSSRNVTAPPAAAACSRY